MRIRKRVLESGNARISLAMTSPPHMDDISRHLELVSSFGGQKIYEPGDLKKCQSLNVADESFEKAPLALLDRSQVSSTRAFVPPARPYMNLDEFVTSLARKNCFPADDQEDLSDHTHKNITEPRSCSLVKFSVRTGDDEESPNFGSLFGAVSAGSTAAFRDDIAEVETTLRLAMSSSVSPHPRCKPASPRTSTPEVEAAEAADQADQTMESSREIMERRSSRHTRVSSSTGRNRERRPSPAELYHDEQSDTQEEVSSDISVQEAESLRRSAAAVELKKGTQGSGSSSTLTALPHADESRNPKAGKQAVAKRVLKRSGRPKKLKYLQQGNVDELGNQCNRRDGKGWICPLLAKPGYQLCDHHLDKLRCKPGSRSKYNKAKRKKNT